MKITQEADYALRMTCLLAKETAAGNVPVGAANLAEGVAVPTRFGLKILHKLSQSELVKTSRGATGGYRLNQDPTTITVRRVIEAIDGPIEINRCLSDTHLCLNNPNKDCCRLHHVFEALNSRLTERLDRLTVAMVVDDTLGLGDLLTLLQ
ncbi:MAG: Rrf2 family transcriptional regulator [Clostridia bacterium]|nr:Rrf2 family transcriptional regulator [Clostridia bacterium]